MTLRRVWGPAQPYPQSAHTDGTPFIRLASLFYMTAGQTWTCVGGRVHIPDVPGVLATGIRIMAWTGLHEAPINLADAPLRSVDTTTPAESGWAEVSWAPFDVVGGTTAVAIGYEFIAASTSYVFTSDVQIGTTDPVQALDGSPLYFAEQAYTGNRSRFRTDGATGGSNAWFGSDIVVDDGAAPPFTAVYNSQEGELWVLGPDGPRQVTSAAKS